MSRGHTLRIGTSGEFKRSPLTVAGFVLFGIAEYALFAPLYWFKLFQGRSRRPPASPPVEEPPPGSGRSGNPEAPAGD